MAFTWTKEQRQVIDLRDRNILVSAAAGSGKTAVLVERILSKISDPAHPVDIDRLLIVTFTNAAAGEMRERIADAIQKKVEEEPDNTHLQRQMTLVHSAQITTIHSFCLHVIRNHFHRISLDPAFRIGDEGELKLLRGDVLDAMLEEWYQQKDPAFLEFVDTYATGRDDSQIRDLILQFYEFSRSYPWPEMWLDSCAEAYRIYGPQDMERAHWMAYLLGQIRAQLLEYVRIYDRILEICRREDGPEPYVEKFSLERERIREAAGFESFQEAAKRLAAVKFEVKPRRKKADTYSEELAALASSLRDRVRTGFKKLTISYFSKSLDEMAKDMERANGAAEQMVKLTKAFAARFSAEKRSRNLVDFSDLEHLALDILMEERNGVMAPTEVADQMARWYDEIMIDEYQDSNQVQEVLLNSVSTERLGRPDMFMVGDVKQSIYKFRLARPELFMEKYETYTEEPSGHQKIELHQNFRSRASVLEGVNFFFYQMMQKELGDIAYTEQTALHPGLEYPETDLAVGGETEVLLLDLTEEEGEDLSASPAWSDEQEDLTAREWEAHMVAARIRRLVDPQDGHYVWDKKTGAYRRVSYGDIVILLRTVSGWAETFAQVLMSDGIPAYAESQSGYFTALEVQVILNLLRLIDNPIQDIPLASVLRSHIGGLSSQDLAQIRMGYPAREMGNGLWGAVMFYLEHHDTGMDGESASRGETGQRKVNPSEGEDLVLRLRQFIQRLDRYRREAVHMPIHQLLLHVMDDSGYYDYVSAMPAGERRKANLDMLVERAVMYEQTSYRGVFQFIRYIEKLQSYSVDYGEASVVGENEDTVRIMSIHKSKGLEFPVVFLCGTAKPFNRQDTRSRMVFHPDFGMGIDYIDPQLRVRTATLIKKVFQKKLLMENLGEELRVLYVAMTRAREKLIITGAKKNLVPWLQKQAAGTDMGDMRLGYDTLNSADSYLDWLIPCLLKHRAAAPLYDAMGQPVPLSGPLYRDPAPLSSARISLEQVRMETVTKEAKKLADRRFLEELEDWDGEEKQNQTIEDRFSFPYHYNDMDRIYATVSVSDLKRQHLLEEEAADLETVGGDASKEDVFEKTLPLFLQEQKAVEGARRGTVYHRVMEWLDLREMARCGCLEEGQQEDVAGKRLRGWLLEQLGQMEAEGRLSPTEKAAVWLPDLSGFYLSSLGKRLIRAAQRGTLRREQQFLVGVPPAWLYPDKKAPAHELVMIQGIIDAWFEEEDGVILVDYKTDKVPQDEGEAVLKSRYEIQIAQYRQALGMMEGKPVKEAWIYSFSMGRAILL